MEHEFLVSLERFWGVPVAVQLRAPYVVVTPARKTSQVAYANDPCAEHLILQPLEHDQGLAICQVLVGAVLSDAGSRILAKVQVQEGLVLEILLRPEDIVAITRVDSYSPPKEPSKLIL